MVSIAVRDKRLRFYLTDKGVGECEAKVSRGAILASRARQSSSRPQQPNSSKEPVEDGQVISRGQAGKTA